MKGTGLGGGMTRIVLTCLLLLGASKAMAEQSGRFFCAMVEDMDGVAGEPGFADGERDRRPSLVTFPKPAAERVAEGYSDGGSVYWYVKHGEADGRPYTIHGTFDFEERRLVTSRSSISDHRRYGLVAIASTFLFLCEPVPED